MNANVKGGVNGGQFRARPLWPWVLLATVLGFCLLTLQVLDSMVLLDVPVRVDIDGLGVFDGSTLSQLADGHRLTLAAALVLGLVIVAIVVPMALLVAFLAAGFSIVFALVCGVGLPAVALLLVGVVLLSPLWLPALAIGWFIRRRSGRSRGVAPTVPTATIAA